MREALPPITLHTFLMTSCLGTEANVPPFLGLLVLSKIVFCFLYHSEEENKYFCV
jgi:hypothetical protein